MKHQDKASWYQCAFRRLAFSTGSGSCQSTHFNQLNVRIEWMWEANGSWGLPVDTESWHISFLNLLKPLEFPSASTRKNSTFHGLLSGIAGGSQDHLPLGQWIPIPIHTQRIPKGRLHVNASKFNSLNNVLKPKKKCFRTFLSTSNWFKKESNFQLSRQPAHQASIIGAQFHFTRHST